MSIELSIIIPCYNEEGNIKILVKRLCDIVNNDPSIEVIFVNNGSTDLTGNKLEEEIREINNQNFMIVGVMNNIGYGNGILVGLNRSRGEILAWTHADLQTNPKDVIRALKLYQEVNNKNTLVKGHRSSRSLLPYVFTFGKQIIASMILGIKMVDIDGQPKLFSRAFYTKYIENKAPKDFGLDLHVMYCASKFGEIQEIPVIFENRLYGKSKGGGNFFIRFKLIKRSIRNILDLKNNC